MDSANAVTMLLAARATNPDPGFMHQHFTNSRLRSRTVGHLMVMSLVSMFKRASSLATLEKDIP